MCRKEDVRVLRLTKAVEEQGQVIVVVQTLDRNLKNEVVKNHHVIVFARKMYRRTNHES